MSGLLFSNMVWIPKATLSPSQMTKLRDKYTLQGREGFAGEPPPIAKLYVDTSKYFGVPRNHGLTNLPLPKNSTIFKGAHPKWPDLKFPNGGTWRPGQREAVDACVQFFKDGNFGGRLQGKCGFGKTIAGLAVAQKFNARVCVLTHKNDLVENWQQDAAKFFPGLTLGHVQGDEWAFEGAHVTTCLVQTLWARKGRYPKGFTKAFDMIIMDEGHRFASHIFEYVLKVFGARYRLAVSATWRRKDGLEDIWNYHIGPLIHAAKSDALTGKYVFVYPSIRIQQLYTRTPWGRILTKVAENAQYLTWLSEELVKAAKKGRKILCVADRVDMLIQLKRLTQRALIRDGYDKTTGLFVGSINNKQIPKKRLEETKKCDIILGTYGMISEGTDIPALDTLFIGTPRSDVEQVVGRIQRKQAGKKSLLVVDPILQGHATFSRTGRKREEHYTKLGFKRAK
tara:strand:+ start:2285 stop:3643 length:1359 start_codon:yes stop_codon:yes gene_type:complete